MVQTEDAGGVNMRGDRFLTTPQRKLQPEAVLRACNRRLLEAVQSKRLDKVVNRTAVRNKI
jgi:hypothetical protein